MGQRLAIAIAIAFSRIASRHIKRRHLGAPPTTSNIIGVHTLELLALDMQIRVARQPLVAVPVPPAPTQTPTLTATAAATLATSATASLADFIISNGA